MIPATLTQRLRARFTHTVSTAVDIDRPAADVWAVLTDFDGYPEWNPQIRHARGELVTGRRVRFLMQPLLMQPPGGRPITIRPRVRVVMPGRELRLRGGLPGIFSGEHWFTFEPTAGGRHTRVIQGETYSGLAVPFIGRILAATLTGFREHNAALKQRVESRRPPRNDAQNDE